MVRDLNCESVDANVPGHTRRGVVWQCPWSRVSVVYSQLTASITDVYVLYFMAIDFGQWLLFGVPLSAGQ